MWQLMKQICNLILTFLRNYFDITGTALPKPTECQSNSTGKIPRGPVSDTAKLPPNVKAHEFTCVGPVKSDLGEFYWAAYNKRSVVARKYKRDRTPVIQLFDCESNHPSDLKDKEADVMFKLTDKAGCSMSALPDRKTLAFMVVKLTTTTIDKALTEKGVITNFSDLCTNLVITE